MYFDQTAPTTAAKRLVVKFLKRVWGFWRLPQRRLSRIRYCSALAITTGFLFTSTVTADNSFLVSLTGLEETQFHGICMVTTAGGVQQRPMGGSLPQTRRWHGSRLRCDINSTGKLTVEVRTSDGNVTRSSTSGGRLRISVE